MVLDTTSLTSEQVSEKLYKHEKEELETLCNQMGLTGEQKELFIKKSLESVYDKEI